MKLFYKRAQSKTPRRQQGTAAAAVASAYLLDVLVEGHVGELDGPSRRARDVPALDVAIPRPSVGRFVNADVHGDGHIHLSLGEHAKRGFYRLYCVALLEHRGDRLVVEETGPRYRRKSSARGLFDARNGSSSTLSEFARRRGSSSDSSSGGDPERRQHGVEVGM